MTIAYVSDSIYPYMKGGKEKRLYELSTRLAKLGHDVHIYTMHWWEAAEKERLEHGVRLHAISNYYPLYNGDKRSIKEAIMFSLACLKLMGASWDVLDVDHMPFFPVYSSWAVCALRGRRRRFYGTWHEALSLRDWIAYMGLAGTIAAAIERVSIHMPHTIIAASNHTQGLVRSQLGRTRRVYQVSSGIDTKLIASLKPARVKCDVLYVGRLVKDKNVDKLVEAIGLVAKRRPAVRCTIIGKGIEQDNIVAQIAQLGLGKNIKLVPPLPQSKDIYSYMKAAKVFCLPSVREGFGIVALEALGCGTPVITTSAAANAAKDLIVDGVDGSIVDLEPAALADAIETWVSQPRPKHIKGKAAGYDWDSLAGALVEVYAL